MATKKTKEPLLQSTAQKRDSFPFCKEICEHLRAHNWWETDVHKWQMAKKKVHGSVKTRIYTDKNDHTQVSCHSNQIKKQKEQEQEDL